MATMSISQAFNNWPHEKFQGSPNHDYCMDLKKRGLEDVARIAEDMIPPVFTVSIGGHVPLWCS